MEERDASTEKDPINNVEEGDVLIVKNSNHERKRKRGQMTIVYLEGFPCYKYGE